MAREKTQFGEYVDKYFAGLVQRLTERQNGAEGADGAPALWHKQLLREEYSADLSWSSAQLSSSIVAADVVSMDSSLPLKSRGSLTQASGRIPKLGVKFRKSELDISNINIMRSRGASEAAIVGSIFNDVDRAIRAMDVRKEILFLSALSTGQFLVADDTNVGTGVRASFGYLPKNSLTSKVPWSDAAKAKPIDDLRALFSAARGAGRRPRHVYMSYGYMEHLRASAQGRVFGSQGLVAVKPEQLLAPPVDGMLTALRNEFRAEFHVVDSSFLVELPSGQTQTVEPWAESRIVAVPEDKVGRLVYGTLPEETNPVAGVAYQKSGTHVLVSKYSQNDPLMEFTAAQALCLPVIDSGGDVFTLDASVAG